MSVVGHLNTLESAGLVSVAQIEPDLEYLFRHTLVQEAAYASLLASDRRRLHLAVGQAVERLYPNRLDELAATLARHYQLAGKEEKAMQYFTKAGETSLAAYANQEAGTHFRSALDLNCCQDETRADLLDGLGEALFRQGKQKEAALTWLEGARLFSQLNLMEPVAELYSKAARAVWYTGETAEGLRLCLDGMQACAGAAESRGLAQLIHETGRAYHFNGVPDKAYEFCQQALDMAARLQAVDVQADSLTTLGVLADRTPEESIKALKRAVSLAESHGLLQIAVRAHHNLGVITMDFIGDLREAFLHYQRATELARQRGVIFEENLSRLNMLGMMMGMGQFKAAENEINEIEQRNHALGLSADALHDDFAMLRNYLTLVKGDWQTALEQMRRKQEEYRAAGNLQNLFSVTSELLWYMLELQRIGIPIDWAEAETYAVESVQLGERGMGKKVGAVCALAILRARQGQVGEARRLLDEARLAAGKQYIVWHEMNLLFAAAEIAEAELRYSDAIVNLEGVMAIQTRMGRTWDQARMSIYLAYILGKRGEPADYERAISILSDAQTTMTNLGVSFYAQFAGQLLQRTRSASLEHALESQKVVQEMAAAGRLQGTFLPLETPQIPGWQIAVRLQPARQTSGDFYDFIPLPAGRIGVVIADVADKGAGAALFMALSHSLIRTYADQFPDQPEQVLFQTNRRILADTRAGLFVTAFYGILDPQTGTLTYCNAGHNPPILVRAGQAKQVQLLVRTGVALGILDDAVWQSAQTHLESGDLLALYTDGVTEAQNAAGELYSDERLRRVVVTHHNRAAANLLEHVIKDVHGFAGESANYDDLTFMVIRRQGGTAPLITPGS